MFLHKTNSVKEPEMEDLKSPSIVTYPSTGSFQMEGPKGEFITDRGENSYTNHSEDPETTAETSIRR